MRATLISAIASCADGPLQRKARKFLQGLSSDELQYIADFLGACFLESAARTELSRRELAEGIAQFERVRRAPAESSSDREHKMIVLLEYLCGYRSCYSVVSFNSRIQMLR